MYFKSHSSDAEWVAYLLQNSYSTMATPLGSMCSKNKETPSLWYCTILFKCSTLNAPVWVAASKKWPKLTIVISFGQGVGKNIGWTEYIIQIFLKSEKPTKLIKVIKNKWISTIYVHIYILIHICIKYLMKIFKFEKIKSLLPKCFGV